MEELEAERGGVSPPELEAHVHEKLGQVL